jgi:cell division protein FtsI (penicillin-binding protein 3)
MSGRIVTRIAPMLGIQPNLDPAIDTRLVPAELRGGLQQSPVSTTGL